MIKRLPCLEFKRFQKVILFGLKEALASFSPEIVQADEIFSFLTYQLALQRPKLKYRLFSDSHASTYDTTLRDTFPKKLTMFFYKKLMGETIKKESELIIAVHESSQKLVCEELGLEPKDVPIVRLGVDPELFSFNSNFRRIIRKKLKIKKNEILVIFAGRITPDKDLEILIDALVHVVKQNKKVKLLILGPGDHEFLLKLKKKARKIKENVIFHKPVPHQELFKYYSAADLGVWPKNITLTITEAMSCSLPVILAKKVSEAQNSDYLLKNKNGLSFERGNVTALVSCLEKLIDNPGERKAMGERSRELAEKEYTWRKMAESFLEFYQQ